MPRQTRRQKRQTRKQKGGAIPFLPRNIAPVSTNTKIQEALIKDFFTKNNIYYVSAHGALLSKKTFEVPAKTYILHVGVSGKVCGEDTRIHELLEGEGLSPTQKRTQLWKFLTGQLITGDYKNILYNPNQYDPEGYNVAIYEPGDIVHDMYLEFENNGGGFIEHGVFKFPISGDLFDRANELRAERENYIAAEAMNLGVRIGKAVLIGTVLGLQFDRDKKVRADKEKYIASEAKKLRVSPDKLMPIQEILGLQFDKKNNGEFHGRSDNLLRMKFITEEKYTMNESELIKLPQFPESPGIRLFIVFSCRGVNDAPNEGPVEAGKRTRRASLNLRKYSPLAKNAYNLKTGKKVLNTSLYYRLRAKVLENNIRREQQRENEELDRILEEALHELNVAPTEAAPLSEDEIARGIGRRPKAAGANEV